MKPNFLKPIGIFFFISTLMIVDPIFALDREHTLKIYNYADYIDESLLEEFPLWYKEQTGEEVKIIYEYYDYDEIVLAKIEKGREDYDVVCCSECVTSRLLQRNLLLPVLQDFSPTPNYIEGVSPFVLAQLEKMNSKEKRLKDHMVGYMWGTIGILYNPAKVDEEDMNTWGVLWMEKYRNSILMKDAYLDVYGPIIAYAHREEIERGERDINQLVLRKSNEDIQEVETLLKKAKPNIIGWEIDFGKDIMTKGKIPINVTFSGDASWSIEEAKEVGVELRYTIPKEASEIWFDGWSIPLYAKNQRAASYFINFLCRPDNVLKNMDVSGYVSCVATPEIWEAMQDSGFTESSDLSYFFSVEGAEHSHVDQLLYPTKERLKHCVLLHNAGDKTRNLLDMWSRIKGDNLTRWQAIIILSTLFIIFVFGFIRKFKK